MSKYLTSLLVISWVSFLMGFTPTYALDSELDPELLAIYVQSSVEKWDKEALKQLALDNKDNPTTLNLINQIIEETKKEIKIKNDFLSKNLQEQELVQSIQNLWKKSLVIDKWWFAENINNGMAKGRCTWYAAVKAFPYANKNNQVRALTGNARDWVASAKNQWYSVSETPEVWSVIVFKGGGYSNLGHVGYVVEVRDLTITIEEMNYTKKFEVSKRILLRNDPGIFAYISLKNK